MTEEKRQILVRNIFWNKHYSDSIENLSKDDIIDIAEDFYDKLSKEKKVHFSIFAIERGDSQKKNSFHLQGYTEFKDKTDLKAFAKKYSLSYAESRQGTQEDAIKYIEKEVTKFVDQIFRIGEPKTKGKKEGKEPFIPLYDINDPEIPASPRQQEVLIDQRISRNEYKYFEDIKKSFPHIFIKQESWIRNLWNKHHPIEQLDVKPARVIWLFSADGKGGAGKTVWTRKYIRAKGYSNSEVATVSPQNITYSDKVYFTPEQERCKVLIINEVDKSFPKYNNLISFIDRNTFLATKGSHIRNNFELIIINSVYRPEKVFSYLGKQVASQIIRRLFNPVFGSRVYAVIKNQAQLEAIVKEKMVFSDIEFQDWYRPILREIKEPNYSLMSASDSEDYKNKTSINESNTLQITEEEIEDQINQSSKEDLSFDFSESPKESLFSRFKSKISSWKDLLC